jgi:phosphoheptose isomerase
MSTLLNDVGNAHIFLRQLLCLARKNDVLIGFSTSGNSKSLIKAFAQAKEMGSTQMGFSQVASGPMVRSSYHADLQASGELIT